MAATEVQRTHSNSLTGNRTFLLSQPKPIPTGYVEDRRSVYWDNKATKDWNSGNLATTHNLTERQMQLINHKERHKEWQGDRPSPIWLVSKAAQNAQPSARVESLAAPKTHVKDFQGERSVYSAVSKAAKNATASARIEALSKHKVYNDPKIKPDSGWD